MDKEWVTQATSIHRRWNVYCCIVQRLESKISLNRQYLDNCIQQTPAFKHDQTTTVSKVAIGQTDIVLKRYNARSFGHKIKRSLRQSRAQRCWNMSYAFAQAGLNVAAPVFMFEERFLFIRQHAYFANEYLSGGELLSLLPNMNDAEKMQVVDALEHAMNIMQEHKISHGDLKATNLLWVDNQLYFIDLDAARQHKTIASWQRANKRDKKRFLKNWRDTPELEALFARIK